MADLRETRRKLKVVLISLSVVSALCVAAIFSPLVGSERERHDQMLDLSKELRQKTRQIEPLRGLDKKIVVANKEIDDFYKQRFPDRDSAISEALGRVAASSGVKIGQVHYTMKDPETVGLQPVAVEATLSGDYLQIVRFINSVEREQLFFLVDSIELGGEQGGQVKLQVRLQTYLKAEA